MDVQVRCLNCLWNLKMPTTNYKIPLIYTDSTGHFTVQTWGGYIIHNLTM